MPKEIREIKHFNAGTILNASEQDIPEDAAAFSLNVNPITEGGILAAINNDKISANIEGNLSYFNTPISWSTSVNSARLGYNDSDIKINDVNIFKDRDNVRLDFIGTKGIKESLTVHSIEPRLEKIFVHNDLVTVFGFADESEAVSNGVVTLTIDDSAGASPYDTSPLLKDAFIGRRIYDEDGNFHGECTNAAKTSSSDSTLTFDGGLAYAVTDNKRLYTKLFLDYTPTAALTATGDYISYNTDITITDTGDSDFDDSFVATGFSARQATITLTLDANIATTVDDNLDGQTFTLTTPDGRIKTYEFEADGTAGLPKLTGTVLGSGNILIGISDSGDDAITDINEVAIQIYKAITHSTGHGGRISVTVEANVLTLTYAVLPLTDYLQTGDYLSFVEYITNYTGRTLYEIMKVTNIDTINKRIYLKRNCFGTRTTTLAATTTYLIFSNRKTINETQIRSNEGYVSLKNWSNYSGNHINGSSTYLKKATTAVSQAGRGVFASGTFGITYSVTNKTIVIAHASASIEDIWTFNEQDVITLYQSGASDNNGYRGKILKQVYTDSDKTLTMTMDTAPNLAETESSDNIFIEANLLKNHTFHHAIGLTDAYKVNDWIYKHLYHDDGTDLGANKIAYNYYVNYPGSSSTQSQNMVAQVASGGYWEDTKAGHNDLGALFGPGHTDLAESYFPFVANDAYITITSDYHEVGTTANSYWAIAVGTSDTNLITADNLDGRLASGDIIKSSTEYMQVISVEGHKLTVIRALYGTDAIAHTALNGSFLIEKSINPCISQDVPKSSLKGGQAYKLSFYAKGATTAAIGTLSLRLNGGYIGSDGAFIEPKIDRNLGIANDLFCQEDRWIDILSLDKINGDTNETLDDVWRLYSIVFYLPSIVSTDLEVEFSSRGPDGTIVHLDLLDLSEHTYVYPVFSGESEIINTGFIDNKGVVDLVVYGPQGLGILPSFSSGGSIINTKLNKPTLSNHAATEISSFNNRASIVSRNREVHVGLGGEKSDTAPQWLGYLNHSVFGKDYSEELYQDEDTVHSYDDTGLNNIKKICLAGEHEYLTAYWNNSTGTISDNSIGTVDLIDNRLRINHASHLMNTGDAIIVREWADTDNSWDGSGVWIVVDGSEDDYFDCRRYNTKDPDPAERGIMTTGSSSWTASGNVVTINCAQNHGLRVGDNVLTFGATDAQIGADNAGITHSVTTVADADTYTISVANGDSGHSDTSIVTAKEFRLCYRPYYYYGIKGEEEYIYRIWPELRINEELAEDEDFSGAKVEQSYPLDEDLVSISTCYNKADDGTGGGRVYGLTASGNILVLDVQVKYDDWGKTPLTLLATINTVYKSYKWSNDHINGMIGGTVDVFGNTGSTTPTIKPTGLPSDILETKGTTSTFVLAATARNGSDGNEPSDLDTRLWIQFRPYEGETFGEGARFLFCGKSETGNTDNTSTMYMGDRSPAMTMILPFPPNYEIHIDGVDGRHVNFWGGPGPCSRFGMYNTPHHGDLDTWKERQYSYYQMHPHVSHNHDLDKWGPRSEGIFNSASDWSSEFWGSDGDLGVMPYVNWGYNMGWQGLGNVSPSVRVAKFGLFPVSDNDKDGVLDGTGVVTANTISLPDTYNSRKMGPYGELHRRVSSHAVGIIAGSDNEWCRHWGKMASFHDDSRYFGFRNSVFSDKFKYGDDAPSNMVASKFAFICTDMHYGDLPIDSSYNATSHSGLTTSSDSRIGENNSHTKIVIPSSTTTINNLQAGDLVYQLVSSDGSGPDEKITHARNINFTEDYPFDWVESSPSGVFTITTQDEFGAPTYLQGSGDTNTGKQGFSLGAAYIDTLTNGSTYLVTARMRRISGSNLTSVGCEIGGTKVLFQDSASALTLGHVDGTHRDFSANVVATDGSPLLITYEQNNTATWRIYNVSITQLNNSVSLRVGPIIKVQNNLVTSYTPYAVAGTGKLLPYSVEMFNYRTNSASGGSGKGSLMTSISGQHFHWAYDKDEPLNGDKFIYGRGCGHYTRTFYSAPSAWGYTPTIASNDFHSDSIAVTPRLPGIINRVDKLSFRSGFMIRPFELGPATFEDLVIGKGIYVDMPSNSDTVYHVNNDAGGEDYLHYHVNDNKINNQFASRMIISCPQSADEHEDLTTKVYICDMNFMYPDPDCLSPQSSWSGEHTGIYPDSSSFNNWDNSEVCYAGIVTGYTFISTSGDGLENATINPVVITKGTGTYSLYNNDVLGGSSIYRDQCRTATTNDRYSMLAGLCISVIDQTHGTCQTRYVVASTSHGTSASSNFHLHVHYPFGHAPVAGDKFYLWRHESACTAPIRLLRFKILRTNLGNAHFADPTLSQKIYIDGACRVEGDGTLVTATTSTNHRLSTNDGVVIIGYSFTASRRKYNGFYRITVTGPNVFTFAQKDTTSGPRISAFYIGSRSNSNPQRLTLSNITGKTMFGGLDMRKLKNYDVPTIVNDGDLITLTSTAHLLEDGDTVSLKTQLIRYEKNRKFTYPNDWAEYHSGGDSTVIGNDGTPANLEITQDADAHTQGAQLTTGQLDAIIDNRDYRITAELWTNSGTLTNVSMGIGGATSSTFSITTDKVYYTQTVEADSDDPLIISSTHNGAINWNIDNVTVEDVLQNSNYIVQNKTANTIDVANTAFIDLEGTLTTNQWETLVVESGNKASIGELRHGFNSWDRGTIRGNIIRHDSYDEDDLYLNVSSSNVELTAGSIGDETGDIFLKNTSYQYKISLMYDGYQEGPLSSSMWEFSELKTLNKIRVTITLKEYSKRLTHVCLYRRNSPNDFFKLVKQIPTSGGWADDNGVKSKEISDKGVLGGTYTSRTGLFETLDTIRLKYGISTEIDGYLFAGQCSHENIQNASNLIFRSKPGMFSIFDYSSDFLTLKSNPTAMVNYLGRLYIFDVNNIYRINPHTLVIEDTFEGIGCLSQESLIVTEQGMFFADRNGAYFHNGQVPTKISIPIQKGGETSVSFGGTDNIKDLSWNAAIGSNQDVIPLVVYDGNLNSVYFIFTINDYYISSGIVTSIQEEQLTRKSYIWAYNITLKRWDLWELCNDSFVGTPFIGKNGSTFIPIDSVIYEHAKGSTKKKFTWLSKKINITYDSNLKVFKKIKVNGLTENLVLDGSYKESSDRLLISTSKGIIANSDITYTTADVNDSDYKLSGSNKRGKWIQFKLEDVGGSLDSVGIVFRTKPIK